MKKPFEKKPYIIATIISIIIGVGLTLLFFYGIKKPFIDGTAYASIFLIGCALLIWIAREGFFDIFAYGFRQLGSQLFSKKPNEYNDFVAFKKRKNVERDKKSNYFIALIIVGLIFLAITVIVSICTNH